MFDFLNSATIAAARRRGGRLSNQGGERRICPPAPPCDLSRACAGAILLAVAQPAPSLESPWLDLALCGLAVSLFVSTAWIIGSREISGENERERERTRKIKEGKNEQ